MQPAVVQPTRSVVPRTVLLALVLASPIGACAKGDAAAAGTGRVDPAHASALTPGTYTMASSARYRGATLRLADNNAGGYSAQLEIPDHGGLYSGSAYVTGGDTVEMQLTCQCRNGKDGFGQAQYSLLTYDGRYRVTDVGAGHLELRQINGAAIDTVTRVAR